MRAQLTMPAPIHAKVVIIGSGPAGYTAAIYAARAMLEPVLIQGIQPGGQLTITTDVENYPGFADVIQGPWLMEQMEKQAAHVGTKIVTDLVNSLDVSQRPFRLTCDSGDVYLAETVILATGAQARWLGLPSESKFQGGGEMPTRLASSTLVIRPSAWISLRILRSISSSCFDTRARFLETCKMGRPEGFPLAIS